MYFLIVYCILWTRSSVDWSLVLVFFLKSDLQLESWKADSFMYGTTDYGDVQGMHMLRKYGKQMCVCTCSLYFCHTDSRELLRDVVHW